MLKQGRNELIGKVDDGNTVVETNENDNTCAFGAGRVLPSDGDLLVSGSERKRSHQHHGVCESNHQPRIPGERQRQSGDVQRDADHGVRRRSRRKQRDVGSSIGAVANTVVDGGDGNDKLIGGYAAGTPSTAARARTRSMAARATTNSAATAATTVSMATAVTIVSMATMATTTSTAAQLRSPDRRGWRRHDARPGRE